MVQRPSLVGRPGGAHTVGGPGVIAYVLAVGGRAGQVIAVAVLAALIVAGVVLGIRLAARDDRPATITQWVAVLDFGTDARGLYAQAADVATVAGVYVFVDRWACYEGFPPGSNPSGDAWFLGVAAPERAVVDDIVARLGRAPIVEAIVEQGCAAPPDRTPVARQS